MSDSERQMLLTLHGMMRGTERQLALADGGVVARALLTCGHSRSVQVLEDFFDATGIEYEED